MIAESGKVYSLEQLGNAFLTFVKKSNVSTPPWDVLTTTLSTFYGGTIRVPITKHKVNDKVPYFYITLQHTRVTPTTYSEFLNQPYHYNSEMYSRNYTNSAGPTGGTNPFKNNGALLAVGLHTDFDDELWMCEQSHVTCDEETRTQINHSNLVNNIILHPRASYYSTNSYVNFPGTGCPWFTISEKNISDYSVDTQGIEYWFTRDEYSATITIRIGGLGDKIPRWQSMSFGLLECVNDESFMFPLYVAGGSQGISQGLFTTGLTGYYPSPYAGNMYDLSMDNISLSNSYLLAPTKFNKSEISNFRVLTPEGIWRNVFAYKQEAKLYAMPVCSGPTTSWGYPLLAPVTYTEGHSTTAFCSDNSQMVDTYMVKSKFSKNASSSPICNISVVLNKNIDHNETGIQGTLTQSYYTWSRTLPCGEVTIKDKKWLSVPNGWEGRKKYYVSYIGNVSHWENETLLEDDENYNSVLNDNVFVHNLLIPLEDI